MRVIAGIARSLPLKTPNGMQTRPTSDRIKETLFNMLQSDIPGAVFVDVFSGSGGIGIEALSRGAKKAYFIENDAAAIQCISQNLSFTKLEDNAIILKQDAVGAIHNIYEKTVDIIFMDPPYASGLEKSLLIGFSNMKYVTEDTVLIVEADLKNDFAWTKEYGYKILKEKCYKTNKHVFLMREE